MNKQHMQVVKTLFDNAQITKQMMKSIRGQILKMTDIEAEAYLKKIIARTKTYYKKHLDKISK